MRIQNQPMPNPYIDEMRQGAAMFRRTFLHSLHSCINAPALCFRVNFSKPWQRPSVELMR
jgi:hypothetical protein